jgi:TonB family protein|tara:strand:+ start:439 stop:777 length:339 start_codon:yes stop_codon:yes gene_type:complete
MKYNQIILLKFIVSSFIIAASPSETIKKPKLENNIKIKYPKTMQSSKVEGKSIAEFIVDEDGSTSQISIVESLGPAFDYEMISAIKRMHFEPAEFEGNTISVKYRLPVQFKF